MDAKEFFNAEVPDVIKNCVGKTGAVFLPYLAGDRHSLPVPVLLYNCPKFAAGLSLTEAAVAELAKEMLIAPARGISLDTISAISFISRRARR